MTSGEALRTLRQSRDAERDAAIWHDDGCTIARLAALAGVRVEFVTVDLRTLTTQRRTVGEGAR